MPAHDLKHSFCCYLSMAAFFPITNRNLLNLFVWMHNITHACPTELSCSLDLILLLNRKHCVLNVSNKPKLENIHHWGDIFFLENLPFKCSFIRTFYSRASRLSFWKFCFSTFWLSDAKLLNNRTFPNSVRLRPDILSFSRPVTLAAGGRPEVGIYKGKMKR